MQMVKYTVRFITPAFLGDSEQKGAWRAPPFKALLRQWWRVLAASEFAYDHTRLRSAEGRLFGHAWLEGDGGKSWAMRSNILLKLSRWAPGNLQSLPSEKKVFHKEVGAGGMKVGACLYLGYGPLVYRAPTTALKSTPAIDAGDSAELAVGYPDDLKAQASESMQLLHWLGTVGGRSRNGWGSFTLNGEGIRGFDALSASDPLIQRISRPLGDCLELDWQHAIGKDEGSVLIWKSKNPSQTWSEAIEVLARAKIDFRTDLPFTGSAGCFEERHVLAYPITHHSVMGWQKGRLANQIRFKVIQGENGYYAMIYHLPCKVPDILRKELGSGLQNDFRKMRAKEPDIWRKVHASLNKNSSLQRI